MTAEEFHVGVEDTGIDITNGKIVAKTDKFEVQNSSGVKTFGVDSNGNLVSSGSGKFEGTLKAKLYYAETVIVNSNMTINLATNPYYTFFKDPGSSTSYIITLPYPAGQYSSIYEGVELRFFSPVVGSGGNVLRVACSMSNGGMYVPQSNAIVHTTQIALKPFNMITMKVIKGQWWVIEGEVEITGDIIPAS